MKTWIAFWSILRKDIKNYYLKPPNISWGIIFPLSWTMMLFIRTPGQVNMRELLPGLMAMSALFGTMSMLAVTITFERKGRSFDRLLLAPVSLDVLMYAKTAGAIVFGIINAFVPVLISALFVNLNGVQWGMVLFAVLFIAITSTLFALLIATTAKEVFEAQTYSNFFRFPMLFLCGLFFPIAKLPAILQHVAYVLPLTYGVDILKGAVTGTSTMSMWLCSAALLGFSLVLYFACRWNISHKWIL